MQYWKKLKTKATDLDKYLLKFERQVNLITYFFDYATVYKQNSIEK